MKNLIGIYTGLSLATAAFSQNPNQLSDVEKCQGFTSLFDGNIATFRNQFVDYVKGQETNTNLAAHWVLDAATQAVTNTNTTAGDIRSKTKYRDFDFRMVYKNNGNQGVFYRFNVAGRYPYESGVELAIDNEPTPREGPKSSAGAAYDLWAPNPYSYKVYSSSEAAWNDLRIVAKKDSVEHWLNGTKVVGYRYHSPAWWTAYDNSKWSGVDIYSMKVRGDRNGGYIDEGFIGFQGTHAGRWYIRNFRLLSDTSKVKLGLVSTSCATSIGPEIGRKSFIAVSERLTGALRIRFSDISVRKVTVLEMGGRAIELDIRLEWRGEAVVLSGWHQPGLYLIKATVSDGSVRHEKIFLP